MKGLTVKSARVGAFDTRRVTTLALLVCVALIAGLVENAFPPLMPLAPGAKLGLGNIAPLLALIMLSVGDAYLVMLVKCLLGALVSGGVTGLMYSVPSGVLALTVEVLLFLLAFDRMSVAMISLIGAVAFNAAQLGVATAVTGVSMLPLLPLMMTAGLLAGAFTGLLAYTLIKKAPYSAFRGKNGYK